MKETVKKEKTLLERFQENMNEAYAQFITSQDAAFVEIASSVATVLIKTLEEHEEKGKNKKI